eukprot:5575342-Prymnesium_polylepis.2
MAPTVPIWHNICDAPTRIGAHPPYYGNHPPYLWQPPSPNLTSASPKKRGAGEARQEEGQGGGGRIQHVGAAPHRVAARGARRGARHQGPPLLDGAGALDVGPN